MIFQYKSLQHASFELQHSFELLKGVQHADELREHFASIVPREKPSLALYEYRKTYLRSFK